MVQGCQDTQGEGDGGGGWELPGVTAAGLEGSRVSWFRVWTLQPHRLWSDPSFTVYTETWFPLLQNENVTCTCGHGL